MNFKRKLFWGWFDIMGIEAGVEYIRQYRHACRIRNERSVLIR